ncbi:MAG: murein transglycosylase A [Ferrovum sp.]|nr:murein transglycosylase A [Ferrovum sp.]
MKRSHLLYLAPVLLCLASCATPSGVPAIPPPLPQHPPAAPLAQAPEPFLACPDNSPGETLAPSVPEPPRGHWIVSDFSQIPDWSNGPPVASWNAFLQSCRKLDTSPLWAKSCHQAEELGDYDETRVKKFFEDHFTPWQIENGDGSTQGLITGYYEPLLHGSLHRSPHYQTPLYSPPPDLLTIDLGDIAPDLKGRRLRGRIQGNHVVPYFSRAEIEVEDRPLAGNELLWVDDPVEAFFLQIQGSGVVELEDGQLLHVGYADQNGHPFRSIARVLIQQHQLTLAQTSMQGIKEWARHHPAAVQTLLNQNPSFVFFQILPADLPGPLGTLGVPLTGQASLAVDPRVIPLGAPVFIATSAPGTDQPLHRLMMAQDTGGAIRGAVRADFFWGFGTTAEHQAGRMKQEGQLWVLYPRGASPPETR